MLSGFATLNATILNMIFKRIPWDYLAMVIIATTIGTIVGISL